MREKSESQIVSASSRIDPVIPGRWRWPSTDTERNWLRAALIVAGCVAVFSLLYLAEMSLGRWNSSIRLVLNPAETVMRYLGISHFLVATLYLATSRRMRTARSWRWFAAMLAVGALLCLGYARVKAVNALLASLFFFVYFLVHSMRDDVFFYFAYGDAPSRKDPEALGDVLRWSPWLVLSVVASAVTALIGLGLLRIGWIEDALVGVPKPVRFALGALPAAFAVAAIVHLKKRWEAAEAGAGLVAFLGANRPIFFVYLATLVILLAGKGYAIVTLHVVAWYVFSLAQMKKRPAAAPIRSGSWEWLRATPAGFRLLHVGSAVLLLAAGAVWAYGFRNNPAITPFAILLNPNAFAYWTILHVTVSFSPP